MTAKSFYVVISEGVAVVMAARPARSATAVVA
jgi:hypothetical protein